MSKGDIVERIGDVMEGGYHCRQGCDKSWSYQRTFLLSSPHFPPFPTPLLSTPLLYPLLTPLLSSPLLSLVFYSPQNPLSFCLIRNVKIKI
jgi:hypothetical protein